MGQIVDWRGRPISSANERNEMRRGEQVEAFSLPDGAVISKTASLALHNRIANDTRLRERLEVAARMTGRRSLHLALLDRSNKNVTRSVEEAIVRNLDHGEKIQNQRAERGDAPRTKAAHENLKTGT